MKPIFITGTGTDVGKTVVAAIVTEALDACYWKPVQAGFAQGTDTQWIASRISQPRGRVFPESYRLSLPVSPHIAAREEGNRIDLVGICRQAEVLMAAGDGKGYLVIEGAGGLLVPLNEEETVADLIRKLDATVLLVSRNYLGSINHSLLTAAVCRMKGLRVAGWVFNDHFGNYEQEIAGWTGIPVIGSIPFAEEPSVSFVKDQADRIRAPLLAALNAENGAIG
jgi:dethiobiotin synthetase